MTRQIGRSSLYELWCDLADRMAAGLVSVRRRRRQGMGRRSDPAQGACVGDRQSLRAVRRRGGDPVGASGGRRQAGSRVRRSSPSRSSRNGCPGSSIPRGSNSSIISSPRSSVWGRRWRCSSSRRRASGATFSAAALLVVAAAMFVFFLPMLEASLTVDARRARRAHLVSTGGRRCWLARRV